MSDEVTVIAGRYELSSLVGEGGMASVWRAKDLTLARPVAIKLLYARDERDRDALVDRFLREARIAASVQHRNVVHIVDFGKTDDDVPYMVMELLQGENLGDRLSRTPPLTTTEFIQIATMTLRGLSAVHQAEIIHRDLKPENIFLIEENAQIFPKILDFGISRSVAPASGRRSALTTKEGVIVGTPEYMSPEQARGVRTIDSRTDIYSMGAILYEGLTGRPPFEAENVGDLIIEIVTGTIVPITQLNPNVPESLSRVIERALEKDPDDRYQTAEEMQVDLLAAAEDLNEFRRSLSDFPPPGSAISQQAPARNAVPADSLEFQITLDRAEPTPALDTLDEAPNPFDHDDGALTTAQMEPYGMVESRRRKRWFVLAGALVIGTIAGIAFGTDEEADAVNVVTMAPAQDGLLPPAEPEAEPAPEPEPEPEPPAEVTIALEGVPQDATVTLDGEPAGPLPLRLPQDEGEHEIIVEGAAGTSWSKTIAATEDATLQVELPPAPKPKPVAGRTWKKKAKPKTGGKRLPSALRKLDF